MNIENIDRVNYRFARNILPRAVVRESSSFYRKYISGGNSCFLEALSTAWMNSAKSFGVSLPSINDIEMNVDISHVYDNGDFLLVVSLPYALSGCDLIGLYIKEDFESYLSKDNAELGTNISISYYMMYKTTHIDKYILLTINDSLEFDNKGYVSASEKSIIDKISKIENKKRTSRIR